jgi:hypothetical protein
MKSQFKDLKSFESGDRILIEINNVPHECLCVVVEDGIKFISINTTDKIGKWRGAMVDESEIDYKLIHHYRPYKE